MAKLDEQLVARLTRRSVDMSMASWPDAGPVPDMGDGVWHSLCRLAGGATPECYEASDRGEKIIGDARQSGRPWKQAAAEAVADLPEWTEGR